MSSRCVATLILLLVSSWLPAEDFDAAQENEVKAYIAARKAEGAAPKPESPNWKAGYTCNDLKKYSLEEYCECRYYYAENGRFYPK